MDRLGAFHEPVRASIDAQTVTARLAALYQRRRGRMIFSLSPAASNFIGLVSFLSGGAAIIATATLVALRIS